MSGSAIIIPGGFSSAHRELERDIEPCSREAILRVAAANDVLQEWGYQLVCPRCTQRFGFGKDGVEANNDHHSARLEVRCGCTVHRWEGREGRA